MVDSIVEILGRIILMAIIGLLILLIVGGEIPRLISLLIG
jgi:hypothetical protein